MVQFRILKNLLEHIELPDYVYAFEKNKSIPTMAKSHVGKKIVISIDLADFFTSIKQYHLEQMFHHLGMGSTPARTLSELCTFDSYVPQGALTSPKISNLITAHTFGPILKRYCDERGYTLTIYADDITISYQDDIPGKQEVEEGQVENSVRSLITFIHQTLKQFRFKVNHEKTKIMRSYRRQYVCGAVVNAKVNLLYSERIRLRAIVHNCGLNGIEAEAAKNGLPASEFSSKVMGKVNWFEQLNPELGSKLKQRFKEICAEQCQPTVSNEEVETQISSGVTSSSETSSDKDIPW